MALVDYGSSEESGAEEPAPSVSAQIRSKPSNTKPSFKKLVDGSNPSKIRLDLTNPDSKESVSEHDGPPAKKIKTAESAFRGFNSFLPAPKRLTATGSLRRGGLGKGVSLKTGATPAFTREPVEQHVTSENTAETAEADGRPWNPGTAASTNHANDVMAVDTAADKPTSVPQRQATIFKPLSVSRGPKIKKPPLERDVGVTATIPNQNHSLIGTSKPPVTLFSHHPASIESHTPVSDSEKAGGYEPMLFKPSAEETSVPQVPPMDLASEERQIHNSSHDMSLDAVASSLNLTASQKRQLLGRNASKSSAQSMRIANFNTDVEYAANEALRQSGEAVQHQAVRPIAGGGKHSLKQLVSSAVGQKDALDEKFAEGSRNRKEGATRYGW